MLSRCDACQKPFVTRRFGVQPCPHCGVGVQVDAPPGAVDSPPENHSSASGGAAPARSTFEDWPSVVQGRPQPRVQDPAEQGFWSMYWAVLTTPRTFFTQARALNVKRAVRFGYVSSLVGFLGSALGDALAVAEAIPADANAQMRCLLDHAATFEENIRPWTTARLPLAPVFALALSYGIIHFIHLLVSAMGRHDVDLPGAARLLAPCLAPLALAALPMMSFGACLLWSTVLLGMATQRLYGLSRAVSYAVAAFPLAGYALFMLLVQIHVVRPCLGMG